MWDFFEGRTSRFEITTLDAALDLGGRFIGDGCGSVQERSEVDVMSNGLFRFGVFNDGSDVERERDRMQKDVVEHCAVCGQKFLFCFSVDDRPVLSCFN